MNLTVVLVNYKCDKRKLQLCLNSIKIDTNIIIIDHSHDFTFDDLTVPKNLNIRIIKNVNLEALKYIKLFYLIEFYQL